MDHSLYRYTCAVLAVLLLSLSGTASAGWITELNKMNLAQPKQATKSLPVEASVRHRNTQTGASVYRRVNATIPVERIRTQAVSAAKRGRIHPGFLAATVAAGLLIDNDTGEVVQEVPSDEIWTIPQGDNRDDYPNREDPVASTGGNTSADIEPSQIVSEYNLTQYQHYYVRDVGWGLAWSGFNCATGLTGIRLTDGAGDACIPLDVAPDPPEDEMQTEPLTEQQKQDKLDPAILDRAEEIARDVMNDPESDWSKDTDADNKIRSPRGAPQNLRDKITRDRENTEAREKGEEEPHDETDGETTSSDDKVMDELTQDPDTLNTPEPPEPDWNVEEYGPDDLQPESIDVGGSSECPAPYSVELAEPFSGTFEIPFDYICDFAENVNPFFIAGAWLLAGFIVIRR